ncbi:MAG TPA: alpha/beta hydrolase [Actinomycetota bacterium]|nr:alpha/beta hydrolase [Actinomycetota bacterium]
MSRTANDTAPPSLALFLSDFPRGAGDLGLYVAAMPLLRRAPRGDGHPVLVLPGLMAADSSTRILRRFLRRLDYHVHGWRLGRNIGPTPEIVEGLGARLDALKERHGRKISVVGWSLGGVYAREIARRRPGDVRQVITLGSPIQMRDPSQSRATRTYQRFSGRHMEGLGNRVTNRPYEAVPVPATSVYSKMDGIVAWRTCLDEVGEQSENVAVIGSHVGLGHNPAALWVVADRLAQPEGAWKPFIPPRGARRLFPRSEG